MKKNVFILIVSLTLGYFQLVKASEDLWPSPLLELDQQFFHHFLIAEKSTHLLHLFENTNGWPKLLKSYQMATGKKAGNKIFQGDFRTPEGFYFLTDFIPKEKLLERYGKEGEIYGAGSFVMDYPNPIDQRLGKTGGGIWIHSTNDETRIEKGLDSRGCIVTANNDLKDLSQYIELNRTAVIVVHNLHFLTATTREVEHKSIREVVDGWHTAWANENIADYLSFYHQKEFYDAYRGDYGHFAVYKKGVFSNPGKPEIKLENISILKANDYAVVNFIQDYTSNTINDKGRKTLYLKRDEYYQWKIVSEVWTKAGIEEQNSDTITSDGNKVAFRPSMRFFKNSSDDAVTSNN